MNTKLRIFQYYKCFTQCSKTQIFLINFKKPNHHHLECMYANVPRSSLHVIQLALLCKVTDLQRCLYESVLSPLIKDLHTLEPNGIFTWPVSWVSQLIIWRPMVLQVLCNLFEDTTSADSVAEKFKTAKFQMVSLP